ncbi:MULTISPECIES: hypothetical protein [Photorhabdus]|nr:MULTISPECIES: hypothetical protein [Photorhabdus]
MHRDGKGANPGSIENDVTECSQQRGNLKDGGYRGIVQIDIATI